MDFSTAMNEKHGQVYGMKGINDGPAEKIRNAYNLLIVFQMCICYNSMDCFL